MFKLPEGIQNGTEAAATYMKTKTAKRSMEHIRTVKVDFEAFDSKGRRHGYRVAIGTKTFERDATSFNLVDDENLGLWFTATPHATKDGKTFGALQNTKHFRTLQEAEAAAEAMIERARKAAQKKK